MRKIINELSSNPRRVLLLDAGGALLTAILLFCIVANFYPYFGMPVHIVHVLAITAVGLFLYSTGCFLFVRSRFEIFIGIVMVANTVYMLVSAGLIILHFGELTAVGGSYFLSEIAVIALLVYVEWKTYLRQASKGEIPS